MGGVTVRDVDVSCHFTCPPAPAPLPGNGLASGIKRGKGSSRSKREHGRWEHGNVGGDIFDATNAWNLGGRFYGDGLQLSIRLTGDYDANANRY